MAQPRAIYVEPQLARDLFGVICTQAFLDGTRFHYLTSDGTWITMQPGGRWPLRAA